MNRKYCQDYTDLADQVAKKERQETAGNALGVALLATTLIAFGIVFYDIVFGA